MIQYSGGGVPGNCFREILKRDWNCLGQFFRREEKFFVGKFPIGDFLQDKISLEGEKFPQRGGGGSFQNDSRNDQKLNKK